MKPFSYVEPNARPMDRERIDRASASSTDCANALVISTASGSGTFTPSARPIAAPSHSNRYSVGGSVRRAEGFTTHSTSEPSSRRAWSASGRLRPALIARLKSSACACARATTLVGWSSGSFTTAGSTSQTCRSCGRACQFDDLSIVAGASRRLRGAARPETEGLGRSRRDPQGLGARGARREAARGAAGGDGAAGSGGAHHDLSVRIPQGSLRIAAVHRVDRRSTAIAAPTSAKGAAGSSVHPLGTSSRLRTSTPPTKCA